MNLLFVLAALVCAIFALIIALGNSLFSSTWADWIAGALIAYFLSLLVPWVETRRGP
jgi:hypothetical protein